MSAPSACFCGFVAGSSCVLLRGGRGVAGLVGLSAVTCVFPVGSDSNMLAGPVRSGWARRLLCARLCLPCGVELHYARGAGAEWLGMSASLRSLVFPVGSDCILVACRPLCARLCLPCGVELCCACGAGAEWLGTSASLRSFVSLLRGRIAPFVGCMFVCMLLRLVRPLAVRLPVPRVGRSRFVSVSPFSVPSPCSPLSSSPPPPPPLGCCSLLVAP